MLTDGRELYGRIIIRYNLDESRPRLSKYVGHIGYEIRKKYRRCGDGTLLLKLGLEKCKELGLNKGMVSCREDNIGSSKVITGNGGIFQKKVYVEEEGVNYNIYWIDI